MKYNWNAVIASVSLLTEEPSVGDSLNGNGFTVTRSATGFTIEIEPCDIPAAGTGETPSDTIVEQPTPTGADTATETANETPTETGNVNEADTTNQSGDTGPVATG